MQERDIENIWEKYTRMVSLSKDENFINFINSNDQRIVECSYSQREKEPFCGPGGLVEYSLELLKNAKNISKAIGYEFSSTRLIKACLLSDIGRIGNATEDRFIICQSDWHKEKLGQYYDWNENCEKYSIQDMSLFHAQSNNIKLSWEEWQAIFLSKDFMSEDNKFYGSHRHRLSIILNLAKQVTLKNEIDKINGVFTIPF